MEVSDMQLSVLYEDAACLVINKPAGIAVHPGAGMEEGTVTLLDGIEPLFKERSIPYTPDAVLVHRLDKDTTGCLLIAKSKEAHEALQQQFQDRTVEKKYLALVAGIPDPPAAMIDAPLGRKTTNRTKMSVLGASKSREARTTYRTIQASRDCALLQCDLHTGRTHQIRVHMTTIDHPILGDTSYVSTESEKLTEDYGIEGMCLHAWKLSFVSPLGDKVDVVAPLSLAFSNNLKKTDLALPES